MSKIDPLCGSIFFMPNKKEARVETQADPNLLL